MVQVGWRIVDRRWANSGHRNDRWILPPDADLPYHKKGTANKTNSDQKTLTSRSKPEKQNWFSSATQQYVNRVMLIEKK